MNCQIVKSFHQCHTANSGIPEGNFAFLNTNPLSFLQMRCMYSSESRFDTDFHTIFFQNNLMKIVRSLKGKTENIFVDSFAW